MKDLKNARLYAEALFEAANTAGRLPTVYQDLQDLGALLQQSPELASFVKSYNLNAEIRQKTINELFAGKADKLTIRFMDFLERKRAMPLLPVVLRFFREMHDRLSGLQRLSVETAQPLTAAQQTLLQQKLAAKFGANITFTVAENPELLGGFTVRAQDRVFDYSVAGRLRRLSRKLMAA